MPNEGNDGEGLAATARMQPERHVVGGSWSVARGPSSGRFVLAEVRVDSDGSGNPDEEMYSSAED